MTIHYQIKKHIPIDKKGKTGSCAMLRQKTNSFSNKLLELKSAVEILPTN